MLQLIKIMIRPRSRTQAMNSSCSKSCICRVDFTERLRLSLSTQNSCYRSTPAPAGLDLVLGNVLSTGEVYAGPATSTHVACPGTVTPFLSCEWFGGILYQLGPHHPPPWQGRRPVPPWGPLPWLWGGGQQPYLQLGCTVKAAFSRVLHPPRCN